MDDYIGSWATKISTKENNISIWVAINKKKGQNQRNDNAAILLGRNY